MCSQHSNQDRNHQHSNKQPYVPFQFLNPHPPHLVTILLTHDIIDEVRLFLEIYINEIMIKVWLLLLSVCLKFIHMVVFSRSLCVVIATWYISFLNVAYFTCPVYWWSLDRFQFGIIARKKNVCMNIIRHVYIWIINTFLLVFLGVE